MNDGLGITPRPRAPRAQVRAGGGRRARWGGFARAAVLVLALGGAGYWARGKIAALSAERDRLVLELAALRDTLGFVRGPATRVAWVPVTTNGRVGTVTIFADSAARRWLVRCEGMAPNEPDETYEIWFVTAGGGGGGLKRAALMTLDEQQSTVMVLAFDIPDDVGPVTGAAMSIEPRGGSAEPRGPMVFHLRL
jgi:anti-sigma-K factor RskA